MLYLQKSLRAKFPFRPPRRYMYCPCSTAPCLLRDTGTGFSSPLKILYFLININKINYQISIINLSIIQKWPCIFLEDILHFNKKYCLHNVSIHINLNQNLLINECTYINYPERIQLKGPYLTFHDLRSY